MVEKNNINPQKNSDEEVAVVPAAASSETKKNEEEEFNEREYRIKRLLSQEKPKFKSLGIGVHKDGEKEVFYFGTTIIERGIERDAIITSEKEIYIGPSEIINIFGLNYRFNLFSDCIDSTWSNDSIKRWLYDEFLDEKDYDLKDLFLELKKINEDYMYYPDKRVHTYIALDILKTYFYPIFETIGRTHLNAEKGSGKSKETHIYDLTAFNPLMSSDISGASFYRVVESTGGTLLIDDFDSLPDEQKSRVIQHIKTGYRNGFKAIRSDGKDNKPLGYNNYSPVVINNILGLDEVTADRCVTINLLKTKDKKYNKKLNYDDFNWQILRDKLHICTLLNWRKVKEEYKNLNINELSDRNLELVDGILAIAKIIGEDVYGEALDFILELFKQKEVRELKDDWKFCVMEYLYQKIKREKDGWVRIKDIVEDLFPQLLKIDTFDRTYQKRKRGFSVYVGKLLKNIPLFKGRVVNGLAEYYITLENLCSYIEVQDFDKNIEDYTSSGESSSISRISPIEVAEEKIEEIGKIGEKNPQPEEKVE